MINIEAKRTKTREIVLEDAISSVTIKGGFVTNIVEDPTAELRDITFLAVRNGVGSKIVEVLAIHRIKNSIHRNRNPRMGAKKREFDTRDGGDLKLEEGRMKTLKVRV